MGLTTAQFAHICRNLGVKPIAGIQKAEGVPARSKYGAIPTWVDGFRFASKLESRHYLVLKIMAERGSITELKLQPRFLLQEKFTDSAGRKHRAVAYVPDFTFRRDGLMIAVDSKGTETSMFRVKMKLFARRYPDVILERWTK